MNIEEVNKQDYLKFLAIICMISDHIGLYFLPNYWSLRAIGRVAFPIFAFYAGYNFKNKLNYKILRHGVMLCLFSVMLTKQFFIPNILISIFIGQLYLLQLHIFYAASFVYAVFVSSFLRNDSKIQIIQIILQEDLNNI